MTDDLRAALEPLFVAALVEAEKAMWKFPQPNYVISKVAEEAGEVVKAAIHCAEGRETVENLVGEIRQAMAMLIRLYVDGDQVHGLAPLAPCATRLMAENERLRTAITDKGGTEHAPTQDAYDAACAALAKHRARADALEIERDRLRAEVDAAYRAGAEAMRGEIARQLFEAWPNEAAAAIANITCSLPIPDREGA